MKPRTLFPRHPTPPPSGHKRCALLSLVAALAFLHLPARSQTPGALDSAFGNAGIAQLSLPAYTLATCDTSIAADGSIFVLASAQNADLPGVRTLVAKFTSAGVLDPAFGPGGYTFLPLAMDFQPRSLVVLTDGRLRVGGHSESSFIAVGLTATGSLDSTYASAGIARVSVGANTSLRAMIAQPDDKLLLAGCVDHFNPTTGVPSGKTTARLLRLLTNGLADPAFGTSGIVAEGTGSDSRCGTCLAQDGAGKIYMGGTVITGASTSALVLRCSSVNGSLDGSVSVTNSGGAISIVPQAGGKYLLLTNADGGNTIARRLADGTADPTFSGDGQATFTVGSTSDSPAALLERAIDGRLFIASTSSGPTAPAFTLLRVRPDAALDPAFDGDGIVTTSIGTGLNSVATMKAQSDGKLVLAGSALNSVTAAVTGIALARYHAGANESTLTPAAIIAQPADTTVAPGSAATFSIVASGDPAPAYQWMRNGTNLSGETSATLTISAAQFADEDNYSVLVTNSFSTVTSRNARLTINSPLTIVTPPAPVTLPGGREATFSVEVSGRPPFVYHWQRNGQNYGNIPITQAGTTSSFSIIARPDLEGLYRVVVTNSEGSVTSSEAALVVTGGAPVIDLPPVGATMLVGAVSDALSVQASGALPMTLQWQRDGKDLGSPIITDDGNGFMSIDSSKAGIFKYRCIVTNSAGSTTSNEVTVNVQVPGIVTLTPGAQLVSEGSSIAITSSVNWSLPTFRYQWRRDAKVLPDNTLALTRDPVLLADGGTYQCSMGSMGGTVSGTARLTVVESSPRFAAAASGKTATITVKTAGPGITGYHWFKDSSPLANGGRISGADTATLKIASASNLNDDASYTCTIDAFGKSVTTGNIQLYVESAKPVVVTPLDFPAGRVLQAYTASVSASAHTTKFTVTGLPAGLTCDAETGEISGSPTVPGTFTVKVTATNPVGPSPTVSGKMIIDPLPMVGTYSGLVAGSSISGAGGNVGTFTMTVANNGSYSGKAVVSVFDGKLYTLPFNGVFVESPDTPNRFTSSSAPIPVPAVFLNGPYTVDLEYMPGSGQLVASLKSSQTDVFTLLAYKNPWSSANPATAYAGYYTCAIGSSSSGGSGSEATTVEGSGYASFTMKTSGTFTLGGKLPDGTAITMGGFIDGSGSGWVFQWLYSNKGCFSGSYTITAGSAPSYINSGIIGDCKWIRPPGVSRTGLSIPNVFFNGLYDYSMTLTGARYLRPGATGTNTPLMMDAFEGTGNVSINLSGGVLDYSIATLDTGGGAIVSASSTGTLSRSHTARYPAWFAGSADLPMDPIAFGTTTFNSGTGSYSGTATAYENVPVYDLDGNVLRYVRYSMGISYHGMVVRTNPSLPSGSGAGFFTHRIPLKYYDTDTGAYLETISLLFSGSASVNPAF